MDENYFCNVYIFTVWNAMLLPFHFRRAWAIWNDCLFNLLSSLFECLLDILCVFMFTCRFYSINEKKEGAVDRK